MATTFYLGLSAVLFCIGIFSFLTRQNALMILMSVELMLNSANLSLVAYAQHWGNLEAQTMALFIIVIAAAEVVVGFAIVVSIFRNQGTVIVDDERSMKG